MSEDVRTWQIDVQFEQFHRGQMVVSPETERIASLVGAGYMHELKPVYSDRLEDQVDASEPVTETVTEATEVASKGRTRKE